MVMVKNWMKSTKDLRLTGQISGEILYLQSFKGAIEIDGFLIAKESCLSG